MDSPGTHPEHDPHADEILLAAAARGLGSRERLRMVAITLWCGFLGAILTLAVVLTLLPSREGFGLGEASLTFLCSWVLMTLPVALALALCGPHHGR